MAPSPLQEPLRIIKLQCSSSLLLQQITTLSVHDSYTFTNITTLARPAEISSSSHTSTLLLRSTRQHFADPLPKPPAIPGPHIPLNFPKPIGTSQTSAKPSPGLKPAETAPPQVFPRSGGGAPSPWGLERRFGVAWPRLGTPSPGWWCEEQRLILVDARSAL